MSIAQIINEAGRIENPADKRDFYRSKKVEFNQEVQKMIETKEAPQGFIELVNRNNFFVSSLIELPNLYGLRDTFKYFKLNPYLLTEKLSVSYTILLNRSEDGNLYPYFIKPAKNAQCGEARTYPKDIESGWLDVEYVEADGTFSVYQIEIRNIEKVIKSNYDFAKNVEELNDFLKDNEVVFENKEAFFKRAVSNPVTQATDRVKEHIVANGGTIIE